MKHRLKTQLRVKKLDELLKGKSNLLIVMQDNPDPDSIAAAVALRKLANTLGEVQCSITHGGTVGRAENRALVRYLGLNLRPAGEIEFEKFDLVAMVDTQPGAGNNCLPANIVPAIVIDHHALRHATRSAQLIDIRRGYGATATILFEYLVEAEITPEIPLATALLYGIRSDTQELGRESSRADIKAMGLLFPTANKRMLGEIQRGSVQRGYFQMLAEALTNARVYGNCIITELGETENPDMIGEVADLLERDEDAMWAMCSGIFENKLLISIRTSGENNRADEVVRRIVARRGTGGGHQTYAGGQIPLRTGTSAERARIEKLVEQKFLKAVGADAESARSGARLIQ
jgi:nanoRNase/pAp phosphatase (c-di-AMP/oligoRNAs hydrolase)